jgi:hypothetical protein
MDSPESFAHLVARATCESRSLAQALRQSFRIHRDENVVTEPEPSFGMGLVVFRFVATAISARGPG